MLLKFHQDPYYFLRYYSVNLLVLSLALVLLFPFYRDIHWAWWLILVPVILPDLLVILAGAALALAGLFILPVPGAGLAPWHAVLVPLGIYFGLVSAIWMHNASHSSFRPKALNRIIGEICGVHQLCGFLGWRTTHLIHHQFPDDINQDPHPPSNLSMWKFMREMKKTMRKCMHSNYFSVWPSTKKYENIWKGVETLLPINRYLRAALLLAILNPIPFVLFFLPSYVVNVLMYVHFNYATHCPADNDRFHIVNLNHNLYYRLMNRFFCGVYFHKNHHLRPFLFNPQKAKLTDDGPLFTPYVAPCRAEKR